MRSLYDNVTIDGICGPVFNTSSAAVATGAQTVAVTGTVVDTKGYNTAALRAFTAPLAGIIPTITASLTVILQESATSTGTFTTANDNGGTAIGFTLTATATAAIGSARIEGLGVTRLRYIRIKTTGNIIAGTGTSLSAFTSVAVLELGRAFNRPVTTTSSNT